MRNLFVLYMNGHLNDRFDCKIYLDFFLNHSFPLFFLFLAVFYIAILSAHYPSNIRLLLILYLKAELNKQ